MEQKKKKLLHIVEAFGGGVFFYMVELANALCKDFDVYIAYGLRAQTPENFKSFFDPSITFIPVENFTRSIRPVADFKAGLELNQIVKDIQPDVIHMHSSKAGALGRLLFSGRKHRLFYTPHGYSFLMRDCSAVKRFVYRILEKIFAMRKCTTISCSKGEYAETLKLTKRAICINNAINLEKLQTITQNIEKSEHPFTVCTIGRITYAKNPPFFNKIALALPEVQFLWIGDGELREQITAPNIKVTGWLAREEALRYSTNADAFMLTSLWEGLPVSVLEAMYMRLPCVVSNVIGNRDVVRNRENGYVCDTLEDFVNAICEIRNGNSQKYVEAAFDELVNNYSVEVQAKSYAEAYRGNAEIHRQ